MLGLPNLALAYHISSLDSEIEKGWPHTLQPSYRPLSPFIASSRRDLHDVGSATLETGRAEIRSTGSRCSDPAGRSHCSRWRKITSHNRRWASCRRRRWWFRLFIHRDPQSLCS